MIKNLWFLPLLLILLVSCSTESNDNTNSPLPPTVSTTATYSVNVQENIQYALGLTHETTNSVANTTMPLVLDVYAPENSQTKRPAFLFIHGGGFVGGDKAQFPIPTLGNFFAERGWVFVSISYRLAQDNGTVPNEWETYTNLLNEDTKTSVLAIYPAVRDAKAALRWLIANANAYNIDTNYVTVGGGSAGAVTAIGVGITQPEDFTNELDLSQDPTLSATNLSTSYQIQCIIDLWGSKVAVDALDTIFNKNSFGDESPPMLIIHGTNDETVDFTEAQALETIYQNNQVPYAFYALESMPHGPWTTTINDKGLDEIMFDFMVDQQGLPTQ